MEIYKEGKRKAKRFIYQMEVEMNELFGKKINPDADGNKNLFWKEVVR